jgi:hypothetical protein
MSDSNSVLVLELIFCYENDPTNLVVTMKDYRHHYPTQLLYAGPYSQELTSHAVTHPELGDNVTTYSSEIGALDYDYDFTLSGNGSQPTWTPSGSTEPIPLVQLAQHEVHVTPVIRDDKIVITVRPIDTAPTTPTGS